MRWSTTRFVPNETYTTLLPCFCTRSIHSCAQKAERGIQTSVSRCSPKVCFVYFACSYLRLVADFILGRAAWSPTLNRQAPPHTMHLGRYFKATKCECAG